MNKHQLPEPKSVPVDALLLPLQRFAHIEASGGIVLFACALIAIAWANSPWGESYFALWSAYLTVGLGEYGLSKPLLLWVNDGLMAVFFFVIGLEIKREVLVGQLSDPRKAALTIVAAFGGMAVPAGIYVHFNHGGDGIRGWGVPMATDIAFALGVLALLGDRVPPAAKVFLTAVAIVDDLGATLVIALFYTESIAMVALGAAGAALAVMLAMNWAGVRNPLAYALVGFLMWFAMLKSGVHPTMAGILGAMAIPARNRVDRAALIRASRDFTEKYSDGSDESTGFMSDRERSLVYRLERTSALVQSPSQRLEHQLHPWVSFAIMPVFALANAGVAIDASLLAGMREPVALGVVMGLVVGKQVGILGFAWLAVKSRLAGMPEDLTWGHLYGLGWLAGIGLTMALFINGLAFGGTAEQDVAKAGVLCASLISGVGGWVVLNRVAKSARRPAQELAVD